MISTKMVNFNDWHPYDGFAEGSGRSEKIWLQSENGEIGLFKYPKLDPQSNTITTEHISEHMAHIIGEIIGVRTAKVDLGTYQNRVGSMSYQVNREDESVEEGALYISGKHPDYDMDEMKEISSGRYYCLDHLLEVNKDPEIINSWIKMMLFDFIIGNSDRHQNNWAFLVKMSEDKKYHKSIQVCPLYDNGSSLCCYITDQMAEDYLGNDETRFDALTDTKSRSMIRIDGNIKKKPTHAQVVRYLLNKYTVTLEYASLFIDRLNPDIIDTLVSNYKGILSDVKIALIEKYLKRKIEILQGLVAEVEYDT